MIQGMDARAMISEKMDNIREKTLKPWSSRAKSCRIISGVVLSSESQARDRSNGGDAKRLSRLDKVELQQCWTTVCFATHHVRTEARFKQKVADIN